VTERKCQEKHEKYSIINQLDFEIELANCAGKTEKKNINK
jgi:hypothetical protein